MYPAHMYRSGLLQGTFTLSWPDSCAARQLRSCSQGSAAAAQAPHQAAMPLSAADVCKRSKTSTCRLARRSISCASKSHTCPLKTKDIPLIGVGTALANQNARQDKTETATKRPGVPKRQHPQHKIGQGYQSGIHLTQAVLQGINHYGSRPPDPLQNGQVAQG
jgi:hypothetical protein